jgi:hypothetical protein
MAVFELENLKPLPEGETNPLYCVIKSWIISFWQAN